MSKAVQFDRYGGIDVLQVRDVPRPQPGPGEVLVAVRAAAINPGEAMIRHGFLHDRWPAAFPSGQGSDLAGVVAEVGGGGESPGGFKPGDEVIGFTEKRASHAEHVLVPAEHLTPKPAEVPWEVAGALFVAGTTAYAAVRAVELKPDDTVAVSAAAGGVGSIAVQLAKRAGATVLGIAGSSNHDWLRDHGVIAVDYGSDFGAGHGAGLADRLRAAAPGGRGPEPINAFLDFFGGGYVELAVTTLGIPPERVDTIIDFAAVDRFGVKAAGNADAANAAVLAELAVLVAAGELEVPIAEVVPLDEVQRAYESLERRHTRGKIVLRP